jgi:hypothetical protein
MDPQGFVKKLLATSPGAPHSIQLEVDVDGDIVALFEVLLSIMTGIIKAYYDPPIAMSKITDEHMDMIRSYFASFGMKFILDVEDIPAVLRINNHEYETKRKLEHMKFQMTDGPNLYTIRFQFMP